MVEDLIPGVVSIASKTIVKEQYPDQMPQFPEGSPFDEFFKEYFDRQQRNAPNERPMIGLGSGFIIDNTGIVVTNNHVIAGASIVRVYFNDSDDGIIAEVVAQSECSDLALLKIPE